MWISDRARGLLAFGIFCALMLVADAGFAAFARRHYLPARKLEAALASPELDVLIAGDSRMAAAMDLPGFRQGWRECGSRLPAVADLSLGGADIDGQAVAVRRFFERGGSAKLVVLGTVPESLTSQPADPDGWIGNEAVVLWWSRLSDVGVHFPRKKMRLDPVTLDRMFRFVAYRTSSLSSLRSLLWYRAQELQDAVVRRPAIEHMTAFGAEVDMRGLAETFVDRGLQAARAGIDAWEMSSWACELRHQAEASGARLVVVELPMPPAYWPVRSSLFGQELRRRLRENFCGRSVDWIDVSSLPEFPETSFSDGLHLGKAAGQRFSDALGCVVGRQASRFPSPSGTHGPN